jgi:hypothetical protein
MATAICIWPAYRRNRTIESLIVICALTNASISLVSVCRSAVAAAVFLVTAWLEQYRRDAAVVVGVAAKAIANTPIRFV